MSHMTYEGVSCVFLGPCTLCFAWAHSAKKKKKKCFAWAHRFVQVHPQKKKVPNPICRMFKNLISEGKKNIQQVMRVFV